MLKRKIASKLQEWKDTPNHKPLVIKGCRQCGKTFSVMEFANNNYEHIVSINFMQNKELSSAFANSLEVDNILLYLSAMLGDKADFVPYHTCIIFDEIQECPNARSAMKFFATDGRYDVIATGSLLGVSGYNDLQPASIPVGYTTDMYMYPLDFEEFLWANGICDAVIELLKKNLSDRTPIPEAIHNRMRSLLLQYVVVGGMPEAVNVLVNDKLINKVLEVQRDILNGYRDDMMKYAPNTLKARIRECFDSIPRQLNKEYKKFQYSTINKRARSDQYLGCLQWIQDAGIINRCHNVTIPELPLDGNSIEDEFKVYMTDIGLLIAMLDDGIQSDILNGGLYGYKGAIFENLIADFLCKAGRKLFYYHKDSGLEIDFLIRKDGQCVLIECKAKTGNAKSVKTILKHPEKYHVYKAIKFGDYNIGEMDSILTLPLYLGFLIAKDKY